MSAVKVCKRCNVQKPRTHFGLCTKRTPRKDGSECVTRYRRAICNTCRSADNREAKNKVKRINALLRWPVVGG